MALELLYYICSENISYLPQVFDRVLSGDLVPYPSYFQNVTGCTNYLNYVQCQVPTHFITSKVVVDLNGWLSHSVCFFLKQEPPDLEYFSAFVTLPDVRRSIHVGNLTFHNGSDVEKHLLQDVMKSIKPWLGILMDNYRVRKLWEFCGLC